jgi:IS1 family transposase
MELKMEETANDNTNKGEIKYWENAKPQQKKRVSFNDILNNMNLVVSRDGILQYMTTTKESNQQPSYEYQDQQQSYVDPSVKHSYIYNKYFKDYKDMVAPQQGPRRPKTIEELKQMLREDKIKEMQRRIRVAQMKPKTMLYTNTNGIQIYKNNLNKMSFG